MKKEKRKKINSKRIIIFIAFLITLLYMIYAVFLLLKQPTNKVTVEEGTLYQEETDVGYIIRKEQVVKGENYKNGMEQIKSEGSKTAKGEAIYRYYSRNEEELKKQISELDAKIQEAAKGQINMTSFSDVKMLENQLDEKISELHKVSDVSKMSEYEKQIKDLVQKKSKITGENSSAGSFLKQLYNQRTKLEEQLNAGAEYIKAPESGIVSYKVDGLEETLTPNNFSAISKDLLENLKLKTGQLIVTSDESGKIIDDTACYIATITTSVQARTAQIDDNVKIRLSNSKVINAKIVYVTQENEQETLLIIQIDKQIAELANYRKISFELIWWSDSGLKVPNDAIAEQNEIKYVVRNRAGFLIKIPVKIRRANEKYAIVSNYETSELKELGFSNSDIQNMKRIALYDEVILKPDLTKIE